MMRYKMLFGHILTTDMNDKTDIEQRKHTLCGQINDLLCYFGKKAIHCQITAHENILY